MFRRNSNGIRIALLVLAMAPTCAAAFKQNDPLPPLDSFKLEGRLPDRLKGQVILLDFWASWCGPCRKSFPAMQELQKQYAGRGLTIVAVSVDDKREDMERFVKTANVSFAVVRDAGQKLVAAADVSTMPTSFLIDRAGKIRCVHRGFAGDGTVKQYQEEIQQLLKEPAP
jgi:thiol-disulfide isomerase/thioredoxin